MLNSSHLPHRGEIRVVEYNFMKEDFIRALKTDHDFFYENSHHYHASLFIYLYIYLYLSIYDLSIYLSIYLCACIVAYICKL